MSDSVTNLIGNSGAHAPAAAGLQNANAPLSDLFANVLDKTTFAERMLTGSEFELSRAAGRRDDVRADGYDTEYERTDAEPPDDTSSDVNENDDRQSDGDDTAENQSEEQPQEGSEADAQDERATVTVASLAVLNGPVDGASKSGLAVQPNTASGVELQSKADGPTPGQARAINNGADIGAVAQNAANSAQGRGQGTPTGANAAFGQTQAGANGQQPGAAATQNGLNADGAVAEKAQTDSRPVLAQSQAAIEGDAEGLGTSPERHTLLIRAGAKRAAELHNMNTRLLAHRDAIEKAITRSTSSTGTQPQNAGSGAAKSAIEITTTITPPAPASHAGPPTRPATPINSATSGALPGRAGAIVSSNPAIGDTIANGAEQSTGAADRQAATSNTPRGLGFRSTAAQLAYQPAEQVKVHIQQLVKSGADRIQIRLSPASLGRVEVALEMTQDKVVQAIVYAEKPETLDMLERDARVLQRAFEEAGMKFDSDSLTFKHGQSGDPDAELANGSSPTDNEGSADGDELADGQLLDTEKPRSRRHDGVLDLEI